MKISQMLKREDFYKINEKTLEKYFMQRYESPINITTKIFSMKTRLYIFSYLNAIISPKSSEYVRRYIKTEYNIKGNILKRIIVKLYLELCFIWPTIFSQRSIEFDKENSYITNDMLIYPCNRKVRIFHFDKNVVDVIVKDGFSNESLINEVRTRKTIQKDFILPIIEDSDIFYREKIIDGTPLARITNGGKYQEYYNKTLDCLNSIVQSTKESQNFKSYLVSLRRNIENNLSNEKIAKGIKLECAHIVIDCLIKHCETFEGDIPVVLSHGDLQFGNVWVEKLTEKIYIIDWESAKTRSIWYDKFILISGARSDKNVYRLLQQMNEDGYFRFDDLKVIKNRKVLASLIALEDIDYRIKETIELPNDYGVSELNSYFNYLTSIICK